MASYSDAFLGEHHSVVELRRLIAKVAASPTRTVLIYGETGSGKGLVARILHKMSARHAGEFVDINCAAIPSSLMESELFGYERGAFTGAAARKTGLVEVVNGGTIFLDEIRELDHTLQAKLLSLLDTQSFRRVGATHATSVDVRFVAATNRILLGEVDSGKFRQDLYYRLQVIAINIPPLRERGDDLFYLAEIFLRRLNQTYGREVKGFHAETAAMLRRYAWPGNVRELEHFLERIVLLEEDDQILPRRLPRRILRSLDERPAGPADAARTERALHFHAATDAFQRQFLTRVLTECGGELRLAAEKTGLTRHSLRYQLSRLGLR